MWNILEGIIGVVQLLGVIFDEDKPTWLRLFCVGIIIFLVLVLCYAFFVVTNPTYAMQISPI